ncbi:Peptidyl-prolyl cis-trans isomerase E [Bienertia sinuspersici]
MGSKEEREYAVFLDKVKRILYLDNLSPQVNDAVIKTAFEQYGTVTKIQFIPNYTEPQYNGKFALVELENEKQAKEILKVLSSYPFMMSGMPRPVRGRPAEPEMFDERPPKPGREIHLYWLDPNDPDFEVGQKLKNLAKKQIAEQSFLLKKQIEEEEKLSRQQAEALKAHYQKFDMMDSLVADGSSKRLSRYYGVNLTDDKGL